MAKSKTNKANEIEKSFVDEVTVNDAENVVENDVVEDVVVEDVVEEVVEDVVEDVVELVVTDTVEEDKNNKKTKSGTVVVLELNQRYVKYLINGKETTKAVTRTQHKDIISGRLDILK